MKVIKPLSSGLILNEDFNNSSLPTLLTGHADITFGASEIGFVNGGVSFDASSFDTLVVEVDNSYEPVADGDMGGIKLKRGSQVLELYEYYDPSSSEGTIPYVRLVKHGNLFYGYGSNDGIDWTGRGRVSFNALDEVHVYAVGTTQYSLNSLKVYKSEEVEITSLLPQWVVKVYKDGLLVTENTCTSDKVYLQLPSYPYTCTVKVFDENNNPVADSIVTDMWGGDIYACAHDITIYDSNNISFDVEDARHLGKLTGGKLEGSFRLHNNSNTDTTVILSIGAYGMFSGWASLSMDTPSKVYSREITLNVTADSDINFWIYIIRPESQSFAYDFSNECVFYLEVT